MEKSNKNEIRSLQVENNRAGRRELNKKMGRAYRKELKNRAKKATELLEELLKSSWKDNFEDETLNGGNYSDFQEEECYD